VIENFRQKYSENKNFGTNGKSGQKSVKILTTNRIFGQK